MAILRIPITVGGQAVVISGLADGHILAYSSSAEAWINRVTLPATAGVDSIGPSGTPISGAVILASPNGTLTPSASGQNLQLDINLANANSWTALQTFQPSTSVTALAILGEQTTPSTAMVNIIYTSDDANSLGAGTYPFIQATAGTDLFVGVQAGNVNVGTVAQANKNHAFGYISMRYVTTGYNNSGFGYGSLATLTTGYNNSAFGYYALSGADTVSNNCAFGAYALSNGAGSQNCAFGYQALEGMGSNGNCCAFGYESLKNTTGDGNCGFGNDTLNVNTTGSYNVAVGEGALVSNTTGSRNTAIGYHALDSAGASNFSVGLGFYAGYYETTSAYTFYIDSIDRGSLSNGQLQSMMYGNFNSTVTSQWLMLNVNALLVGPALTLYSSGAGIFVGSNSTNNAIWTATQGSSTTTLYIGNASINVTASSLRFKEMVNPSAINALGIIDRIPVRDFYYKEGPWRERGKWTGLIAEEIMQLPELKFAVTPDTVEYHHLVPLLIKAIQELNAEIKELKNEKGTSSRAKND